MDMSFFVAFAFGFAISLGLVLALVFALMKVRMPSEATMSSPSLPAFPVSPEPGMAVLYVLRPSRFGFAIPFGIHVDDRLAPGEVAKIRGHQYVAVPLSPGQHALFVKTLENCAEAHIDVAPGQTVAFMANPTWGAVLARVNLTALDPRAARFFAAKLSRVSPKRVAPAEAALSAAR